MLLSLVSKCLFRFRNLPYLVFISSIRGHGGFDLAVGAMSLCIGAVTLMFFSEILILSGYSKRRVFRCRENKPIRTPNSAKQSLAFLLEHYIKILRTLDISIQLDFFFFDTFEVLFSR